MVEQEKPKEETEEKETEVIRIRSSTKKKLDAQKAHPSMSYDAVIFAYVNGSNINWNRVPEEEITKEKEDLILEHPSKEGDNE